MEADTDEYPAPELADSSSEDEACADEGANADDDVSDMDCVSAMESPGRHLAGDAPRQRTQTLLAFHATFGRCRLSALEVLALLFVAIKWQLLLNAMCQSSQGWRRIGTDSSVLVRMAGSSDGSWSSS